MSGKPLARPANRLALRSTFRQPPRPAGIPMRGTAERLVGGLNGEPMTKVTKCNSLPLINSRGSRLPLELANLGALPLPLGLASKLTCELLVSPWLVSRLDGGRERVAAFPLPSPWLTAKATRVADSPTCCTLLSIASWSPTPRARLLSSTLWGAESAR